KSRKPFLGYKLLRRWRTSTTIPTKWERPRKLFRVYAESSDGLKLNPRSEERTAWVQLWRGISRRNRKRFPALTFCVLLRQGKRTLIEHPRFSEDSGYKLEYCKE